MTRFSTLLERFLAKVANPNRTVAFFSLIIEILGSIVLAAIIVTYIANLNTQTQVQSLATIINDNMASIIGYSIMLLVLFKSIGSDLYDLIWHKNKLQKIEKLRPSDDAVAYFLRGIQETYIGHLRDFGHSSSVEVRLNIMLRQRVDSGKEMLQIRFAANMDQFSELEQNEIWHKGQGKCGCAWKNKKQEVYASDIQSEETKFATMGEKTTEASLLKSVLSTPVIWNGEVIAVLNIDSRQGGQITRLQTPGIKIIFNDAAHEIAPLIAIKSIALN
jgi:hypothetical protein